MSSSTAQLRFAIEFTTFLVALASAAAVAIRPDLLGVRGRSRAVSAAGFLLLASAAFLRGSLLTGGAGIGQVLLRGAAIALLALGASGWTTTPTRRRMLWGGLVVLAAAEVAAASGAAVVGECLRGLVAAAFGVVLVSSARRAIAARFAAGMTVSLLAVVLAVSGALSVVIGSTVEGEALKRVDARTGAEVDEIQRSARRDAAMSAKLAALSIEGTRVTELLSLAAGAGRTAAAEAISSDLGLLVDQQLLAADGPLIFLSSGRSVVAALRVGRPQADGLAQSPAVSEVIERGRQSADSVVVSEGRALALGAYRVTAAASEGVPRLVGVVVAAKELDRSFLQARIGNDPTVTLALVGPDSILASFGPRATDPALVGIARRALSADDHEVAVHDRSMLAARAVLGVDDVPVMALVSAVSGRDDTRRSLFRSLFLAALLAALMAFILAIVIGERIGIGLGQLTSAAERIERGDLSVRADVSSQDEVGELAATFNSMAMAIESLAAELRRTAVDEAQVRGRLEAVVAGMGEALVAVDAGGLVTTFNRAAEELFGVGADEVLGHPIATAGTIKGEDGGDLSSRLAKPSKKMWGSAAVLRRRDRAQVPVALSASSLVTGDGGIAGAVYVLRDMRREREAEMAKSELLSNISHELRTPLVPIKGYAELLLRRDVPPAKARQSLTEIVEAADRLEQVVQRLLDVAAQQSGPLVLRREPIEIRPMVEAVIARWRDRLVGHRLMTQISPDLPVIEGDRQLLERCLDELIDNAVKFSPDGGPVHVEAVTHDGAVAGMVVISVIDTGIGVAADRLSDIFEDFSQGDSSASRHFGGLGLGLALVRRIVAAHGGEVSCESTSGEGSRFSMIVPPGPSDHHEPSAG